MSWDLQNVYQVLNSYCTDTEWVYSKFYAFLHSHKIYINIISLMAMQN